jgi:cystathionine beta-synthase
MEHRVDAIVCGVGSGGTMTGLSRFFARVQPAAEMVLADPLGSALAEYVRTGHYGPNGTYLVEGIGQSCVPEIADLTRVRKAYSIPDAESMHMTRELLRKTGILAGPSTGTLLAAALRYCQAQKEPKRVVTFACDTGAKYLSKVFNDYWMMDQGFVQPPATGGIRDLITRRYDAGAVITVGPDDTLLTAFRRMKMADVSQVPVMQNGRCVGVLDESDLLVAVHNDERRFSEPVRNAMSTRLETVSPDASIADVYRVLDRGLVALVVDGERFVGLITRTDLLNHLRRRMQ